jgi:TolB protein
VGSNSFTGDWSPDGTALAFASSRDGSYDIYRADVEGRTVERLTNHPYSDFAPAWSPDGNLIAFISRRDSDGEAHLFVMRPDGTEVRRLSPSVLTGTRSYFYPAWRPSP